MKALVQSRDAAKGGANVGASGQEEEKEDNRAKALANAKLLCAESPSQPQNAEIPLNQEPIAENVPFSAFNFADRQSAALEQSKSAFGNYKIAEVQIRP